MDVAPVGLVVIILGWLFQLLSVLKGKKELAVPFLAAYIIGVAILVVDGVTNDMQLLAALNLATLLLAGIVLAKLSMKK